jgi:hypothetical protein
MSASSAGLATVTVTTQGGVTTTIETQQGADGSVIERGTTSGPGGGSWVTVTTPGSSDGSSTSTTVGTETTPWGTQSTYEINRQQNADGSSSFSRTSDDAQTGEHETTFGAVDKDGNSSVSSSVEYPDGSTRITTRTVDQDGNGTEHTTVVGPNGEVISDSTTDVSGQGGSTSGQGSGGSGGGSGSSGSGSGSGGGSGDDGDSGDDDKPADDPDDPEEPDQPDSPDSGAGSGMPSDDGTDDRAPVIKLRHPSTFDGILTELLQAIQHGSDDEDEGSVPDFIAGRHRAIVGVVKDGGGADESGWGSGGEGLPPRRLAASGEVTIPVGADDTGWGNTNDPRMMVAMVASIAHATGVMGRSWNLVKAIR